MLHYACSAECLFGAWTELLKCFDPFVHRHYSLLRMSLVPHYLHRNVRRCTRRLEDSYIEATQQLYADAKPHYFIDNET